jgi:hypothetical protein
MVPEELLLEVDVLVLLTNHSVLGVCRRALVVLLDGCSPADSPGIKPAT